MQYFLNTALCNEYWATIPPKTDLRCLAFTLVQQFHNNPPHVTDITAGKKEPRGNGSETGAAQPRNKYHTHTRLKTRGEKCTTRVLKTACYYRRRYSMLPHSLPPQDNKLLLFSSSLHAVQP